MARPIQYTPQYIPMDLGAMTAPLEAKQRQYDIGYQLPLAFEDQFSQIQVSPENIPGKQAILSNFQSQIQEIVDRYGGDYGAASRDIARTITKERQNPFYQIAPQHTTALQAQQQQAQKLGDYGYMRREVPRQFIDKEGNIVSTDLDYDIGDVRAVDPVAESFFKEKATERSRTIDRPLGDTGYREVGSGFGFRTQNDARQWLYGSDDGQKVLYDFHTQYGVNPGEHPALDKRIESLAMANLVGEEKVSIKEPNTEDATQSLLTTFNSPELKLEAQPYSKVATDYKKATKRVLEIGKEISGLERQLNKAMDSGNTKQANFLQSKIDKLNYELEPIDTKMSEVRSVYAEPYQDELDAISLDMQSRISEIISDEVEVNKLLNVFNASSIESELKDYDDIYAEMYGDESLNELKESVGKDLGKVWYSMSQKLTSKKKLEKKVSDAIDKDIYGVNKKGTQESSYLLPQLDRDAKTIKGVDGSTYESSTYRLMESLRNAPEAYKFEVTDEDKKLDPSSRKYSKFMDNIKSEGEIIPISAGESDAQGRPFINAKYKDEDGNTYKVKVLLDKRSDKTKLASIARDYMLIGDIDNVARFTDPSISNSIDKAFRQGNMPNKFNVSVLGDNLNIVKDPVTKGYKIINPTTGNPTRPMNREDLKYTLYQLYLSNIVNE